jgi:integrase
MSASKGGIYQRGEFWLDFVRGAGGKLASSKYYIWWYEPASGKQRRKSTGTGDVRLACDKLDEHYLANHLPTKDDQRTYTASEALVDYFVLHGQNRPSAESIKARLKLMSRFIDFEVREGRLRDPILPAHLNSSSIDRFRKWALADPVTARKKDEAGEWVKFPIRKRSPATVEEAIIQLKAALNYAVEHERLASAPIIKHRTRDEVTPKRTYRLSVDGLAEMLDFASRGAGNYAAHADLLTPLRCYLIGSICTLARPDAVLDMSVNAARGQWMKRERRFDLNPANRIQTKKYRPVLPVAVVLHEWLTGTDDFLVSRRIFKIDPCDGNFEMATQIPVASVRSGWDTMRAHLGIPLGWGPKLIRHSMATLLANRGVSMFELEIALGHRPLSKTTDRYVIFSPEYLKTVIGGIEDVLNDLSRS